jgi:hypothetical protein
MKKIIFILLLFAVFGFEKASAQSGLNNNSDVKVPVPGNINTTTPFIRVIVPAQPTMPTMPGAPLVSPVATVPSGGLMPSVPVRPAVPTPSSAQVRVTATAGGPSVTITGVLPTLPILPPVSPIPPMPEIRLPRIN